MRGRGVELVGIASGRRDRWSARLAIALAGILMLLAAIASCSGPSESSERLDPSATAGPSGSSQPTTTDVTAPENNPEHSPTSPDSSGETPTATASAPPGGTATIPPDAPTPTTAPQTPTQQGPGPPTATATPPPANPDLDPPSVDVRFQQVASGFVEPTFLTHAGDGSGTLYVTEKGGRIRTLDGGLFMDLTDRVINTGLSGNQRELGLLGLAFHPDYESNGFFYVHYNDLDGNTVVSRFQANPDGSGNPNSEKILLTATQSEDHFNGGMLAFGPDGNLYLALGTGGNLPEDHAHSQDLGSIFGKILRFDIDGGDPYAIPPDNPYVDVPGARGEVWVYGLRNPWRFAFDRATGDLYIADAGQFGFEWAHFQAAGPNGVAPGGVNFGWPIYEGRHCFDIASETASDPSNCEPPPEYQPPIFEYPRGEAGGCVIIGGYVYRGAAIPDLRGAYLFSDFCSARISAAWRDAGGQWQTATMLDLGGLVSSFGEDEAGELYVLDIGQGLIYRMVPG